MSVAFNPVESWQWFLDYSAARSHLEDKTLAFRDIGGASHQPAHSLQLEHWLAGFILFGRLRHRIFLRIAIAQ